MAAKEAESKEDAPVQQDGEQPQSHLMKLAELRFVYSTERSAAVEGQIMALIREHSCVLGFHCNFFNP